MASARPPRFRSKHATSPIHLTSVRHNTSTTLHCIPPCSYTNVAHFFPRAIFSRSCWITARMDTASTKRDEPSHTPPDQEHEIDGGPQTKKRKVRKGTRSCWECRRRKMKCIFGSPADTICVSCKRRGAKCVDQQLPEQISTPLDRSLQMGDRVVRVEALVEQLLKRMSNGSESCCGCTTTRGDEKSSKVNSPVLGEPSNSSCEPESLNVSTQCSNEILGYLLTYFLE